MNENKAKSSFPALVELWLTHVSTYRLTNPVIDASLLKRKNAPGGGGEMCLEEEEEEEEIPGGSYVIDEV